MDYEAIVTLAVLAATLVTLVREWASPPATLLGAIILLVLLQVVEPEVAFAGFSNPATFTVGGLFVVAHALQRHSGLRQLLTLLLADGQAPRRSLLRLSAPVGLLSSVVANTPIVAALAPAVRDWADRHGRPSSQYLMPLSFATILGGVITTIGTSTTLVVSGLLAEITGEPLSLFEITPVGLPLAAVGVAVMVVLAPRLLPDRRSVHEQLAGHEREYSFRLQVIAAGPYDGRSVADAGLRNLRDVYLVSIEGEARDIAPVPPETVLRAGDVLTFAGGVDQVRDLTRFEGLTHAPDTQSHLLDDPQHVLVEAVVGPNSPLAGRTLKDASFRGRYGGAVVAVHRAGERVEGKLGQAVLHTGDALLILTDQGFVDRWRDRRDFAVVVGVDEPAATDPRKRAVVLLTLVAMVATAAFGWLSILEAVLGAVTVLAATGAIRFREARDAVDLDVLIIIAAAIGLGAAVESSGLAGRVADVVAGVAVDVGDLGALAAVLLITLVLTELVTNVAAAGVMLPIAVATATSVGADPRGFAVAVALGASASFLTPIGYQTNTIVYGLGGYRFGDYWRFGLPLTLLVFTVGMLVIPAVWD